MYLGLVLIVMIVSGTYILLSLRNIEIDKSRQEHGNLCGENQ